jgi:hypothetical protein
MRRRRRRWPRIALGTATLAMVAPTVASAHGVTAITIRHQVRGCHTWSANSGPWRATLRLAVDRDRLIQMINNDVMPHRLVQTAGPRAVISGANMNRMGARAQLSFRRKGVYRFTTRAGDEYRGMMDMHTVGRDYTLRLVVSVT